MLASASTALKIDVDQFRQQLRLLGYSQDETIYLRKFAPKKVKGVAPQNKQCTMRDLPRLQLPDGGLYFVVNGGGQKDEDVTRCRALFWEFDDRPIEEQFFVWREKNLPEPSFQVVTRKSVHTYLAIAGGCTVEQWDELTLDLIDYLGSDPSLKNQSRVMRVAGAWHIAQDAEPVMCELVNVTDKAYSYEELRAAIPQRQPELTPYVEQQAIAPVDLSDRLSDILHKDILPRLGASAYNWTGHDWATESATKKRGCCPWHESESGTAFYIDLVNGEWLWNCPSCQFGGDVVSYRDRLHGGSGKPRGKAYVELVKELASDSGISLPDSKADQNIQSVAIQRQSEPGESQDKVIDSLADLKTLVGQYAAEFDPFKKALIENQIGSDFKVRGSRLEKLVDALTPAEKRDAIDMSSLCQQLAEQIEARSQNPAPTGLATCFYDLDAMTGGLQRGDLIITAGRPSMGKCLGRGTQVVMFDGTLRAVEDVKAGDLLMGDDSSPRKVLSIARGREMMYWVRQNSGQDYRVNESHILSLKRSRNEGSKKHGDVLNISVREYLGKSEKFKSSFKGYKVEIDFIEQPLPVNPYFLGLWLGDGSKSCVRISNPDQEVRDFLSSHSAEIGQHLNEYKNADRCKELSITSGARGGSAGPCLQKDLRSLGLLENKHIPQIYLSNSKNNRLQLLAGLLDTDGYYDSKFNVFEIIQKSKALIDQIKFLCDSLGFKTTLREKVSGIKSTGFSGLYYRLRIFGNLDTIPTRIERKQARPLKTIRDWRMTGIQVEPDKVDDYYGFVIDGNHLFLLGDMTVTHNTAFALQSAMNAAKQGANVAVFSLEMSSQQLGTRLLSAETGIEARLINSGRLSGSQWETLGHGITSLSGLSMSMQDGAIETVEQIREVCDRLHAEQPLDLVVIDYLQLMEAEGDNRNIELSRITRKLKKLALDFNVPVNCLSQLSRGVESRKDKRPMMSDLRESGAIEQDADLIMMLYRDEYYNAETVEPAIAEIIITKHRNGPVGTVKLLFEKEYTRFKNLARRAL